MTWLEKMVEIGATPDRTASEEEIIGYERLLGVQFPQSFREFLMRYGACELNDRDMVYPVGKDVVYHSLLLDFNEIKSMITRPNESAAFNQLGERGRLRPLAADGCSISLFPNNRSPNIAKIFPKRIVGNIRSIEFNFLRPNHLAIVSLWIGLARQ